MSTECMRSSTRPNSIGTDFFVRYKPGNVKLQPALLKKHQIFVKEKINAKHDKPVVQTIPALMENGIIR